MLQLRSHHDEAMKAHAIEQYVERTLAQFQEFFPRHCEINGEERMREMIRLGVKRAKAHGIIAQRNVVLYSTMMLLFGSYFDEDPLTPWAQRVLGEKEQTSESRRADRLYSAGTEHWERIAGPENRYMVTAIMRLRKQNFDEVASQPEKQWPAWMQDLFPARCHAIGPPGVVQVMQSAKKCASKHFLTRPRDRAVLMGSTLLLGCRFDEDPMYPWAAESLRRSENVDNAARGNRLLECVHGWADAWMARIGEEV